MMAEICKILTQCRWLAAAAVLFLAAAAPATVVRAQQVVVVVGGEPITALDIEQRSKLEQLSTQKMPPRQKVLDELIDEKLKIREAKKFGLDASNGEVDQAYAAMAARMRVNADQLTQMLAKGGVHPPTLKQRIRADIVWQQLVRGRFQSSFQIDDKDLIPALESVSEETAGFDYTLRPILFIVPQGSSDGYVDGRKREAEALRGRFNSCEEGLTFVRALKDVAIREQVTRSTVDIPPPLRKILDSMEIGKLTPPEVTTAGIQVFALCGKKESSADNTPGKRKARESILAQRFEQRSKAYLQEVRRGAMIEYK
jgi:peptidyl-prolyl cis-trans isomerase SurA